MEFFSSHSEENIDNPMLGKYIMEFIDKKELEIIFCCPSSSFEFIYN